MDSVVCLSPGTRDGRSCRGAVRYPLHLRVTLLADGREREATTEDISASGVLFRVAEVLQEGQKIEFLVEFPAGVLEVSVTAAVHCSGRIVRCFSRNGQAYAGAVIDEYRFQ